MIPQEFQQQLCALLGESEAGALCTALSSGDVPTSIRNNPFKPLATFDEQPLSSLRPVPWCAEGRYLAQRPSFAHDPRWHAGAYYVQEAASMFIAQAYRVIAQHLTPQRMLDLCAAPGGKSTLWRSLLPHDALLVANEPMRQRAQVLAENLTKWGHPLTFVTQAFPEAFHHLENMFDVIATDVPCSGEGMFRKDEQAREEWSPAAVVACAERQRSILSDVWPALKVGGFCVYSTCTFNREENEDLVAWICAHLGAELVPIPTDASLNIAGDTTQRNLPVYHFFPHRTEGEGLFLALLRKTDTADGSSSSTSSADLDSSTTARAKKVGKKKQRTAAPAAKPDKVMQQWLAHPENYHFLRSDSGVWTAVPQRFAAEREQLLAVAPLLVSGIDVAEEKGKKLLPLHPLAMSTARADAAFPTVEVDRTTALSYLHREAVVLPPQAPRGHVLLTFEGFALGFANNLGNRANNLYPNEWRLRML